MLLNSPKFLLLLAFFFSLIITISCKKDGNSEKVVVMNVGPKLIAGKSPSIMARPDDPTVVYYYDITDEAGSKQTYTLSKGNIEDFDYVEGYQYKIKVKITPIDNPPADGPIETYSLVKVLSKTKVDNP